MNAHIICTPSRDYIVLSSGVAITMWCRAGEEEKLFAYFSEDLGRAAVREKIAAARLDTPLPFYRPAPRDSHGNVTFANIDWPTTTNRFQYALQGVRVMHADLADFFKWIFGLEATMDDARIQRMRLAWEQTAMVPPDWRTVRDTPEELA